ncbi:MAG: hypothetical protein IV085_13485 [Thiobacillus sp.]|nr:hypothetical protein [Thiobacillus sp.]
MIRLLLAAALSLGLAACAAPGGDPSAPARKAGSGTGALPEAPPPPAVAEDPMMCTMDAKMCPDGSYVSRNPNKGCAFNPCPGAVTP